MQHLTPDHPETQSQDGITQNLTRLHDLFPEAFSEGRLNFDVLKQLLGDQIDDQPEKYGLTWNGKARARRHALTPTRATLRPDPASSVDWDTTQNLMIEGDNLEVLKLLQRSYAGKVKLIYIDPPYNTGKDFVYPDDYTDSLKNYQELTGQLEEGRRVSSNTESSGRFHTDWLNMMYPRLKLARELLRDDGVIFVSIDDSEKANTVAIMDDIFGENCRLGIVVRATGTTTGQDGGGLGKSFDYGVFYSKSPDYLVGGIPLDEDDEKRFQDEDERGKYSLLQLRKTGNADRREDRPSMFYPIKDPSGVDVLPYGPGGYESRWRFGKDKYNESVGDGLIVWKQVDSSWKPYVKYYLEGRTKRPSPLWDDLDGNKKATIEVKSLLAERVFDNPKPTAFVRRLLQMTSSEKSDIVLDFFAGSGSTAHAVMSQNAADNLERQFIAVQLPELLDPLNKEQKFAADFCDSLGVPRNIAELTKERLRRAGAKVKAENPMFAGDTGFRVFKLDSSNIAAWDGDAARADVQAALLSAEDNIKAGRTDRDVLYEVLLKLGLPLTTPIEERTIAGLKVQLVGGGALVACLERRIAAAQVQELGQGMADWLAAENPAGEAHVLFLDSAFENDNAKLNLSKYLSQRAEVLGRNWVVRSL
ncbi:DNA methylase N-4 [Deinococcus piscis]|uniref:DNA methylase N-4 n=1 Tax=Deinococcus piscis TaxID=394230 RepID=A0ABQ3KEZ9_9DEIO|nr:site-specific DNA-methyltransferase [Deinococcus piscis]GHG10571.1 DNA methylase N-4 [Deinococcus piscis]